MTPEQINKMRELRDKGLSYVKIGKLFNISKQRVHQLLTNYTTIDNNKLKHKIKTRDNYTCQLCNVKETPDNILITHHIDNNPHNNNLSNLITVCRKCHSNLHTKVPEPLTSFQKFCQKGGKATASKRFAGKTPEEISKYMQQVSKGNKIK